jgi:hypothetical protein
MQPSGSARVAGAHQVRGDHPRWAVALAPSTDRQVSDMAMGGQGAFRDRRSDRWPASGPRGWPGPDCGADGMRWRTLDPLTQSR